MRHAYALRKFNRVGPPAEPTITIPAFTAWLDPEPLGRACRQLQEAMPTTEEISRHLAAAARGIRA